MIDEFDATLHPSAQKKLFDIILDYAETYRIQVFFTTHSLYLLTYAHKLEKRIIYLVDQVDSVSVMQDAGPSDIEMHLSGILKTALYQNVFIPVYTEDPEARLFLEQLLDYISKTHDTTFARAKNLLHLVDASIGSEALKSIFEDTKTNQSSIRAICILDGDQKNDIRNHIITLPGGEPPDRMFAKFLRELTRTGGSRAFWDDVQEYGYNKAYGADVLKDFDSISEVIKTKQALSESAHGVQRALSKTHFKKYQEFYDLVIKAWLRSEANEQAIASFRDDLFSVFRKTAAFHSIDSRIWPEKVAENAT